MYVLVLGLDVLGNPFGLIRGLSEGVEAFFYEPYQVGMHILMSSQIMCQCYCVEKKRSSLITNEHFILNVYTFASNIFNESEVGEEQT